MMQMIIAHVYNLTPNINVYVLYDNMIHLSFI